MKKKLVFFSIVFLLSLSVIFPSFSAPLEIQILQQVVSVGTSATKIPAVGLRGRDFVMIKNIDSAKTIYIGSVTVTADEAATGGDQLLPSERVYMEFSSDIDIYGIVSAGTANAAVLEGK